MNVGNTTTDLFMQGRIINRFSKDMSEIDKAGCCFGTADAPCERCRRSLLCKLKCRNCDASSSHRDFLLGVVRAGGDLEHHQHLRARVRGRWQLCHGHIAAVGVQFGGLALRLQLVV